jgi:tellurite resistance protein TehA-like permease
VGTVLLALWLVPSAPARWRTTIVAALATIAVGASFAFLVLWGEQHSGTFDAEHLGPSVFAPVLACAVAAVSAAVAATHGPARSIPLVALALGWLVLAGLAALKLPGVADGITREGILVVAALVLLGVASAMAVRPAQSGAPSDVYS